MMRDRPYDEVKAEHYRNDPLYAIGMFWYLLFNGVQRDEWRIYWRHVRLALRLWWAEIRT
jgi:hypothetical protein